MLAPKAARFRSEFIILSAVVLWLQPLLLKGQFEHFRNRESVFKEYKPYFDDDGQNVTAIVGQTVSFKCPVRNLGDRYVLSSGFTKFSGDRRVTIQPADRSHIWGLTIRNVTTSDESLYLCQVNTEPKISLGYRLIVSESHANISGNKERYVQAGSKLILECQISHGSDVEPEILWHRDGVQLQNEETRSVWGTVTRTVTIQKSQKHTVPASSLIIDSVNLEDSGVYTCSSDLAKKAEVTVVVTSGEQRAAIVEENGSSSSSASLCSSSTRVTMMILISLCGLL